MVFVTGFFAVWLLVAALRAPDRLGRWFYGACCLLNLGVTVAMLSGHPGVFVPLLPNPDNGPGDLFRR